MNLLTPLFFMLYVRVYVGVCIDDCYSQIIF